MVTVTVLGVVSVEYGNVLPELPFFLIRMAQRQRLNVIQYVRLGSLCKIKIPSELKIHPKAFLQGGSVLYALVFVSF